MAAVDVLSRVFGLLALLVNAATVVAVVALVRRDRRTHQLVRAHGVGAAAAVTGVSTLGSLYYSEVVGYPPCSLCWFQRIFMYAAATILLATLLRYAARVRTDGSADGSAGARVPDETVWRHVVPLALAGLPISLWHLGVERAPALGTGTCALDNPCSTIWVEVFNFITLPYMAATGFAFVLAVAALHGSARRCAGTLPDLQLVSRDDRTQP